jgi:hypothetical protein
MSILFSSFLLSAFSDRATDWTAEPNFMVDSSNDVISRKEMPHWGSNDHVTNSVGVESPKTPFLGPEMQFPLWKWYGYSMESVIERRKVAMELLQEVGVDFSDSALLETLRCPLAAELALTSFPP